jgi:predicted nuclease of predicted toxin-antitoxin system
MLRLASDENFNGEVVRGLLRRRPDLDIVRTQDVGLLGADDPTILAWAAAEGRILLTQDRATMPDFAYERVRAGQPMPGVFVVGHRVPIGLAIREILLLADCSEASEWEGIVLFLPL